MQHVLEQVLAWLSQPANGGALVGGVLTLSAGLFVHLTAERRAKIANALHLARVAAERIRDETPGADAWDPVAAGLAAADRYLLEHGWRALNGREAATVRGVLVGVTAPKRGGASHRSARTR